MRKLMGGAVALALAGCGGGGEPPEANVATANLTADNAVVLEAGPMLGGVDLSQRVQARGKRPEWLIDLWPGTIYFWDFAAARAEPDQLYYVAPTVADGRAVFETRNLAGETAVLTLRAEGCTDPADPGAQLPLTAELVVGSRTLRGCAGTAPADAPRASSDGESAASGNATE